MAHDIEIMTREFFASLNEEYDYTLRGYIEGFGSFIVTAWSLQNAGGIIEAIDPENGIFAFVINNPDQDIIDQLLHASQSWTDREIREFRSIRRISYEFRFPHSLMWDYDPYEIATLAS